MITNKFNKPLKMPDKLICTNCGREPHQIPNLHYIDHFYYNTCKGCGVKEVVCGSCIILDIKCKVCKRDDKIEKVIS